MLFSGKLAVALCKKYIFAVSDFFFLLNEGGEMTMKNFGGDGSRDIIARRGGGEEGKIEAVYQSVKLSLHRELRGLTACACCYCLA